MVVNIIDSNTSVLSSLSLSLLSEYDYYEFKMIMMVKGFVSYSGLSALVMGNRIFPPHSMFSKVKSPFQSNLPNIH